MLVIGTAVVGHVTRPLIGVVVFVNGDFALGHLQFRIGLGLILFFIIGAAFISIIFACSIVLVLFLAALLVLVAIGAVVVRLLGIGVRFTVFYLFEGRNFIHLVVDIFRQLGIIFLEYRTQLAL